MKFLHISDLHYSNDYQNKGGSFNQVYTKMTNPLIQLKSVINQNEKYDFILVTGDICEYGTVQEYKEVKSYLEKLFNCPVIGTAGNHDNIDNFEKGFNALFYVKEVEKLKIISFNSADKENDDGMINEEIILKLKKELAKETDKKILLITHHHLLEEQFVMKTAINSDKVKEIIKQSNTIAIFTGHTHHFYVNSLDNKAYFTTGSLSFVVENENEILNVYQQPLVNEYKLTDKAIICRPLKHKEKLLLVSDLKV